MAKSNTTKSAPRKLPNVAAQEAQDAQEAKRLAGQAAIDKAIAEQLQPYRDAEKTRDMLKSDAEKAIANTAGIRERMMIELSKLADKGQWNKVQIDTGLDNAIFTVYAKRTNEPGTHRTLKSELMQAMLPESREHIARVITDAVTAWDRETRAIETARENKTAAPATPLRDKYGKRNYLVMDRVRAAQPKFDSKGKIVEKAHMFANADEIVQDAIAKPKAKRDVALSDLKRLQGTIKRFCDTYDVDAANDIKETIDALTVDDLLGTTTAKPKAAEVLKPKAAAKAEPVDAPAELDDVLSDEDLIALATQAAVAAVMARRK
jgi:hypothetical protein